MNSVLLIILIILIILGIIYSQNTITGGNLAPLRSYKTSKDITSILRTTRKQRYKKGLAKRLTDAGWVLYTKKSCPWCHVQIDMFGNDKILLNVVDCSDTDLRPKEFRQCSQTWVYPTWVNKNMVLPGSQSFIALDQALKGNNNNTITLEQYRDMKQNNT